MKRVLTGRFMHETNTFSIVKTDMALWRRRDFHTENEIPAIFRGTRSALGATFEAADKYGWTLVHPVSANANPSGIVTDDAFDDHRRDDPRRRRRQGPIDGVLFHLHGAMVTDSHEDGEGELLERLRRVLGPDVPIVVTLDLHANVTQKMADNASALIAFRTYPHIDHVRARLAGRGAAAARDARRNPAAHRDRAAADAPRARLGPHATGADGRADRARRGAGAGRRGAGGQHLRRVRSRQYPRCRAVGDRDDRRIARQRRRRPNDRRGVHGPRLGDHAITHRSTAVSVAEAVARAAKARPATEPLVVADFTDNPGGGGYGDATAFLKGLVEAGAERVAFHAICDPEAVAEGMRAGIGPATLTIGGKTDPRMGGGPLTLTGEITCLTNGSFIAYGPMGGGVERNYGPSMVFRVGGIDIVADHRTTARPTDLGQFTSLGIDPTRYTTVAVKSMQHFRAAFEPIAREVILVDTGALCPGLTTPELFDKVRRPVWPLDPLPL